MKIRGILIKDGVLHETELEDSLDTYRTELDCDCIDIVSRRIGNKYFDIVCDDEGLYRDGYISMMDSKTNTPMLVGRLFICNHNGSDLSSLTQSDIDCIKRKWKYHVLWGSL
jgi:hypothetical protein